MNQGVGWGVAIAILLVIAGIFVWRSTTPTEEAVVPTPTFDVVATLPAVPAVTVSPSPITLLSPSPIAAVSTTVSITDTGFAPASLKVAEGTTVTFINNGQAAHWPASDPHPVHTGLSGFDAKRGLATGETYSFTFSTTGTFGCHDNLNPTFKCSLVVE